MLKKLHYDLGMR